MRGTAWIMGGSESDTPTKATKAQAAAPAPAQAGPQVSDPGLFDDL